MTSVGGMANDPQRRPADLTYSDSHPKSLEPSPCFYHHSILPNQPKKMTLHPHIPAYPHILPPAHVSHKPHPLPTYPPNCPTTSMLLSQ